MITFIQMPSVRFDWMVQRPQQLMKELSKLNSIVYYIEPEKGRYIKKYNENLYILGMDVEIKLLPYGNPVVLWCSSSDQIVNVDKIPHDYIVYDIVDDASYEFKSWGVYIEAMIKKADIIITASESLFNKFKSKHRKVFLINNGVDIDNFKLSKADKPLDMPTNKKIVGYSGAVASWIDWGLIESIVKDRNLNFVFVGPFFNRFRTNVIRSNVYYLGIKPYEKLPYYINNFDCCIIPFRLDSMTNSCNPIKFYEYLSLGKPIICTAMDEVKKFNDLCYVSNSKEEFYTNIKKALNERDNMIKKKRIETAVAHTWKSSALEILNILKTEFNVE